jgi:hypothetical protein
MSSIERDAQVVNDTPNRAYDTSISENEPGAIRIGLMNIDETIIKYLNEHVVPQIKLNEDLVRVPIMYATQERWKSIQKDGFMRDTKTDKVMTPIIVIRRTSIAKGNLNNPVNKYLYRTFETSWNKRNMYDRFAVQNKVNPSRQYRNIIIPDYIKLGYEVVIWTEFQEQLNSIIEQVHVENDEYWGNRNAFKFSVNIRDYNDSSDLPPMDIRAVRATFNMEVDAYIVPERISLKYQQLPPESNGYTYKKLVTFIEATGSLTPNRGSY